MNTPSSAQCIHCRIDPPGIQVVERALSGDVDARNKVRIAAGRDPRIAPRAPGDAQLCFEIADEARCIDQRASGNPRAQGCAQRGERIDITHQPVHALQKIDRIGGDPVSQAKFGEHARGRARARCRARQRQHRHALPERIERGGRARERKRIERNIDLTERAAVFVETNARHEIDARGLATEGAANPVAGEAPGNTGDAQAGVRPRRKQVAPKRKRRIRKLLRVIEQTERDEAVAQRRGVP